MKENRKLVKDVLKDIKQDMTDEEIKILKEYVKICILIILLMI